MIDVALLVGCAVIFSGSLGGVLGMWDYEDLFPSWVHISFKSGMFGSFGIATIHLLSLLF